MKVFFTGQSDIKYEFESYYIGSNLENLEEQIESLNPLCGAVYIFTSAASVIPLYIGSTRTLATQCDRHRKLASVRRHHGDTIWILQTDDYKDIESDLIASYNPICNERQKSNRL